MSLPRGNIAGLAVLACGMLHSGLVSAKAIGTDKSFEVQLFQSAIGPGGYLTVDSAEVPAHKQFSLSLINSYQRSPFSIYTVDSGNALAASVDVVRNQITSELAGAIGLLDKFQLGVAVPMTLYLDGQGYTAMGLPSGERISSKGIGDIRLEGKARVARFGPTQEFLLSAVAGITLPSGNQDKFLGDKTFTGRVRAVTEFKVNDFRAAATLGFLFRDPSDSFQAKIGQQLLYGVAADYRVHRDVSLLAELFGRSGLSEFDRRWADANPVEVDAAMRVGMPNMLILTAGAGIGMVKGIGSPMARIFAALSWAPDFRDRDGDGIYDVEDRCPNEPEDADGYKDTDGCPEADNDGDGLLDQQDKCPVDAEDLDQFEDEDGCPEMDNDKDGIPDLNDPCPNAAEDGGGKRPKDGCPTSTEDSDGDGIPDANDKCSDEPEDRDGFQDYDGCPDPDNDSDGIPDNFDGCPNEAEDSDGFEDTDGCPDPDNDHDGVPDGTDKCPLQPETLNGNKDEDGCPDPGAEIVALAESRIDVRERIAFAAGPEGKPVLTVGGAAVTDLVAMLLNGHPELARLRVEVYADGGSKEESQVRAEAVVAALVGKKIEAKRLRAVGMGPGGNRVDFVIEHREESRTSAPAAPGAPANP